MTNMLNDPMTGFTFGFELDKAKVAYFTGCSGISMEFDVVEFKSQSDSGKTVLKKMPGAVKYSEIVLKRGVTDNMALQEWMKTTVARGGAPDFRTVAIVMYDMTFQEVARFNYDNAFPSKLSTSDLSAGSNDVVIEEMTIQHQMMEWI